MISKKELEKAFEEFGKALDNMVKLINIEGIFTKAEKYMMREMAKMSNNFEFIEDSLLDLVDSVRDKSDEMHGMFSSFHEALSVTREEVEESEVAVNEVRLRFNKMWETNKDDSFGVLFNNATELKKYAIHAALELLQVAAMADKEIAQHEELFEKEEQKNLF